MEKGVRLVKKSYLVIFILGLFFLVACAGRTEENEVIGPFLRARADLYQKSDQIVAYLQEITSSQMPPAGEEVGSLEALDKLEPYLTQEAYDGLLGNRKLLEDDFFKEDLDKVQVENIQYKPLKEEGDRKEMDVTYDKVKTREGKEEREKREEIFILKKEKGSWKILDIRDK
ncbi:hypothetical protein [Urinicoccus massiliensis]|uniref:hypothetical protein n=1 Tax=Urinicoccus massiliensis TaxID=1723382 RepID=UPI0009312874|nr:hypothetical protein [Urinicoccus massiliensis]